MDIDKNKIYYVPFYDTINEYANHADKPIPVYLDYVDKYGKYWMKKIVSNTITYINGKPWYDVNKVSQSFKPKEFTYKSQPEYTVEVKSKYNPDEEAHFDNVDWIYDKLVSEELVVIQWQNEFYVKSSTTNDGKNIICTHTFSWCDDSFWSRSNAKAISYTKDKVFKTYNECMKYIRLQEIHIKALGEYSDEDYSLLCACKLLKMNGYNAQDRHDYLELMKKMPNLADVELHVRDGKVYADHQTTNIPLIEKPEATDAIKRSKNRWREFVEQSNYIDNNINWYTDKRELVI